MTVQGTENLAKNFRDFSWISKTSGISFRLLFHSSLLCISFSFWWMLKSAGVIMLLNQIKIKVICSILVQVVCSTFQIILNMHFQIFKSTNLVMIHGWIVQKVVRLIMILNPIDGVIRLDVLLPSQKCTEIRCKSLTIRPYLRISLSPTYVINKILCNMFARWKGQPDRVG